MNGDDDRKAGDEQSQKFSWDKSIVDLMKVLKLDSSLTARKELAKELGYKGALNGSAEMNTWLHKKVMTKLAEGGGRRPTISNRRKKQRKADRCGAAPYSLRGLPPITVAAAC